jgi:hypothetical protein
MNKNLKKESMTRPKLMIIGYGRHGKDTVCDIIAKRYGYTFQSSSMFCAELFIYETLKDRYGYSSIDDCYEDRHNHRSEWYNLIKAYNSEDPTLLGRQLYSSYDIYCGLRNAAEFHALRNAGVFDYSIWVDRSAHLPPESSDSISVEPWMADYTIDNNGSLELLHRNTISLINRLINNERLVSTRAN